MASREGDHNASSSPKRAKMTENLDDYLEKIHDQLDSLSKIHHATVKNDASASDWGVFVKAANGSDARFMLLDNMTDADGQWCMTNLEKSYYSHENVKTYDEKVRKSVSSKTFSLCHGVDALLNSVRSHIPESAYVILKPYKFNCHGEGCFFQEHKDTKNDKSLIGTLILIPCSSFEGGDLSFPIQNRTIHLSDNSKSGLLQFVYFDIAYSHAVTRVESGFRFSIVFNVYSNLSIYKEPIPQITSQTTPEEVIRSFARDIHGVFKDEKNILLYDVFDPRLTSELRTLFTTSIEVYFGKRDPDVVYDSYDGEDHADLLCSDDDSNDADFESTDFSECVEDATLYQVSRIIGKSSKLITEQTMKGFGGNSPCTYYQRVNYFKGILLNPSDPKEPNY